MRVLWPFIVTILLGASPPVPIHALDASASWEAFGRDQGISGSSVTAIVQDSTGFLWFSTQSGLNRWDGTTMKVWQKEPFSSNTLSHNLIQSMYVDGGEVLWLGTYGGLDRFDTTTEIFRAYRHEAGNPASLSHNVVTRVYRDARGQLWVGTLDGLNRLDEKTGLFRVYPYVEGSAEGLAGKTVRSMVNDASGRLWVGSSGGLNLYDADQDRLRRMADVFPRASLPSGAVMASLRLPGERLLWLAVWGVGLLRFNPDTGESQAYSLPDNRVFGLDRAESNELLVGTWGGGLVVFHTQTNASFAVKHEPTRFDSLAHDVVYGAFQDSTGLIWVATNGGAVSRYNPRRQQFRFTPTGGKVPALFESRDHSIWAGVYNVGLVKTDPQGRTTVWKHDPKNSHSLTDDIVNGITEDGRGRIWVMTNRGVSIVDQATGKVTPWATDPTQPGGLSDEVVDAMTIDHQGRYWFGTYRSGVVRRPEPGTDGPVTHYVANPQVPGSLPDNLVYFVYEDRGRRIWIGTNGGLALYRPETDDFRVWKYSPEDPQGLPGNTVRNMIEDSRGRLWVVTNGGGISQLNLTTGTLETYGLEDGLSSLSVYSAQEDASGLLWITTANGLFSFRPETKTFRRFGVADGLASAEFSSGAIKTSDGKIILGALAGLVSLDPLTLADAGPPPAVALSGIQVRGEPRVAAHTLNLGWQENSVTFSLAVLDFRNPKKNLYAYRLDGFDRDWIHAGNRHEATYTNLWPGTYRFRFKGANPADVWGESPRTVLVTVEPPPWASWYAWLFYLALFIAVVYLYQRARVSNLLGKKVSDLEMLRAQLEEANSQLDKLARLDGLTSIPNRRAFDTWISEEWSRAQRQRLSVAALMVDIDDFKRYNDFYGHLAGDNCLKSVAQTLSAHLHRNSDFCARIGGEEFVVLLHDTDLEGARVVAQRMLEAVDQLAIPHQMATAAGHVTVSIGVASLVPLGADHASADLLHAADQALYRAKALGRHRVETN